MRRPRQQTERAYDYVVVGAGAAGCAVAGRLSQRSDITVLLLEAGGRDRRPEIHIPAAFSELFRSRVDWDYHTDPQPGLDGRSIFWPRGKVLGGSTSINAMMWVRGFAADYDEWAAAGGDDWGYRSLVPYFRRVERVQDNTDPDQGSLGAINIESQREPRTHTATFLRAATQAGHSVLPPNGAAPEGFSATMVNQRRGTRFSAADGYLKPAAGRRNLTVRTGAIATRVLFDGIYATGVEYLRDRVRSTVTARREVVLAGGTVNTPQLLLLSGIGPREALTRHGIGVVADSPEVGANLQDHLVSGLIAETLGDTLFSARRPAELARYLTGRRGMLTSNVAEAYGFVRTEPALSLPDIEIIFAPVAFVDQGLVRPPVDGLTIGAILLRPASSGTVTLRSADPLTAPAIDPRYLSDADGRDRATLLAGLAVCEELLRTPALRAVTTGRFVGVPGAESMTQAARDELTLTQKSHTLYHPVGTARMGADDRSVVDPQLRVRGVRGLRIADASIMPNIIRGHTQAPAMVIGEKAADLLFAG